MGCVIMASGQGNRFGSNKLMADFGGSPLILRIIRTIEELTFLKPVIVTRNPETAAFCQSISSIPVLLHSMPHRSDTIQIGLSFLSGKELPENITLYTHHTTFKPCPERICGCFFCLGDQPLLSGISLKNMALALLHFRSGIFRLSYEQQDGSPLLFSQEYFTELLDLPQGKGGSFLAKKYPGQVIRIPARNILELFDIDTPEDLSFLREKL